MSEISSIDTTRAGACRALLIGSDPDRDLPGVHEDVMAMASALDQLGWDDIRLCHEHRATRRNILRAVDALIARTEPGDAVVVYYAGHGSRARAVSAGQRSGRPLPAFIVPMDIDHSSAEDFRGISDLELSLELARLTARTRNVTVIMDCCHSGRVVRGPRGMRDAGPVRVRFRPDCSIGIDRHLAALRRERDTSAIEGRQSDPHAIRILACEPSEQALEVYEDGRPGGVLTRELIRILTGRSAGTATWRLVASVLREAVRSRVPSGHWQTPQIEGPIDRVPFETRRESSGHLASTYRPDHRRDELRLRGGYLLDMQRGDRYQVRPLPHQRGRGVVYRDGRPATPAHPVEVEVTRVGAGYAVVTSDRGEDADVPAGAPAFLIARSSPGRPVVVRAAGQQRDPARAGLRAAIGRSIERSLFVRVAEPAADGATDDVGGDAADDVADDNSRVGTDADPVLATVTVGDDLIELRDGQGVVREWREPGAAIDEVVVQLEQMARAAALLARDRGSGERALSDDLVAVDWGQVVDGRPEPVPAGDQLAVGDRYYVRVRNRSDQNKLHVAIYDVGVAGAITLLTATTGAGIELTPGAQWTLGQGIAGDLYGMGLGWPSGICDRAARAEHLLVVVSDRQIDLRGWQTRDLDDLERTYRDSLPAVADDIRYRIEHIAFTLSPRSAAVAA